MTMHYAGIDLGTTNSAICTYDGDAVRIHKSPEQNDVTPSAIFFGPRGAKYVGQRAYNELARNEGAVAARFKRQMGTRTPITIAAANLVLTPEECSAEVLRTLFGYLGEELRDAGIEGTVITVPAAFSAMAKEATLIAAENATIGKVLLLQEPVAAVMSVMQASQADGRFLIYDLGGGTLDVAVAESGSGHVTLLAHGGIPMCGGRDLDRLLVEHLVWPWLRDNFALSGLKPGSPELQALERLSAWAAEGAKIELSSRDSTTISLSESDIRLKDGQGRELYVEVPLTRQQLERLASDLVARSVDATRVALSHAGLTSDDIERIVFVGGPTHFKPLRDQVSTALGIPASTEVNPMTAVAQGAALFAETVDWGSETRGRKPTRSRLVADGAPVSFSFVSRTPGRQAKCAVQTAAGLEPGHEYQVDSLDTGWSSGRLPLRDGAILDLPLTKPGDNHFKVFLFAPGGLPVKLPDDRLMITRTAATVDAVPASHSIGVEVLERLGGRTTLKYLVRADAQLPIKDKLTFKAAEAVRAGSQQSLNFKLWEGEIEQPVGDNRPIGTIKILGSDLDEGAIQAGADLVCDYEVSESGNVSVAITVPSIGATFRSDRNFYSPQEGQIDFSQAAAQVASEAAAMRSRVDALSQKVESDKLSDARERLDKASGLAKSPDAETAKEAMDEILEAKRLLAQARKDQLAKIRQIELDENVGFFDKVVKPHAKPSEVTTFQNLVRTATRAQSRDDGEFEVCMEDMHKITAGVLWRQPWFLVDRFNDLASAPQFYPDGALFAELVASGRAAVEADDMDALRVVIGRLFEARISLGSADGAFDTVNIMNA